MTVRIDPLSAIEPEKQGAKRRRAAPAPTIIHTDKLNQPLTPGTIVAFAFSYGNGINIGTVIKNTRQRVRIAYKHNWRDKNGNLHTYEWNYLAQPSRVLALTDTLSSELIIHKLRGQIP